MAQWAGNYEPMWAEAHTRPYSTAYAGGDDSAFLNAWVARVPSEGGCRCRDTFRVWLSANPPDYSSRDAYFAWFVRAHNSVNAKLDKPQFTVQQALERYAPQHIATYKASVHAPPETLDPEWYLNFYVDLRQNGVHSHAQAVQHWHMHGARERRAPNAAVEQYRRTKAATTL